MTTPFSSPPQGNREHFDTGPLSWVIGEIGEALTRSKVALGEALVQDAETRTTTLHHAKNFLHQAHGALQMVDVDGVAIITETVEDLFDRFESGQLALTDETVHAIGHAYQALIEYLEELLVGVQHQPVRLFPYYQALLQVRGAERIHPADLFFPNLAIRPHLPASSKSLTQENYISLRKRFERALLAFLKSDDASSTSSGAQTMRDIIKTVEHAQTQQQVRAFWWVMHGFAEAVAAGQVANELYVKQLFARINLQIRRLSEGSASITERLLRDALFFIARVAQPTPLGQQIRVTYQLDGVVPVDYETKRYGQIDAQALASAKDSLTQAKNLWNRIAGGNTSVAEAFEREMNGLAEASTHLNSASLSKLLRELGGIARHAAHSSPGDSLSLEIATSLLFVENALQQISNLPDDFAERANALTTRLLAVVSGDAPTQSADWLDEMSRQAQERQTLAAVGSELQSSLRHAEKLLDEYFRDTTQTAGLDEVNSTLHQMSGALSILDQEDAAEATRYTQKMVRDFISAEQPPSAEDFEKVAQNVGALSFFIETLQLHPDGVKDRFVFDAEQGIFHAHLTEKKTNADSDIDVIVPVASAQMSTVEAELAAHQKKSGELARSLAAQPNNPELQEQLKESLEQVRLDATLIDNPEVNDRATAAIDMLGRPDFIASQADLEGIAQSTEANKTARTVAPISPVIAPETEEAIDAELLEIFLSEAVEVLECIRHTIPESRNAPYDQEHMTTLRRSFHTLKGSSRMVGLMAFGEAAWNVEQVLNLRLSETRAGDADLYAMLENAATVLGDWVNDLQNQGGSNRTGQGLIDAAERLKDEQGFSYREGVLPPYAHQVGSINDGDEFDLLEPLDEETEAPPAFPIEAEELHLSDDELAQFHQSDAGSSSIADVIDFPVSPPVDKIDDNAKYIGDLEISLPLYNIYLAETDELVRVLSQDIAEWRHEPDRPVNFQAVHAAHSLAGSSATVGFTPLQEVAHELEMVLQLLLKMPVKLLISEYDALEHAIERIRFMLQMFALGEMPDHEPEQVEILARMPEELEARSTTRSAFVAPDAATSVTPSAADPTSTSETTSVSDDFNSSMTSDEVRETTDQSTHAAPVLPEIATGSLQSEAAMSALDAPFEEPVYTPEVMLADPAMQINDEIDTDLLPVFIEEGRDILPQLEQTLRTWQSEPTDVSLAQAALRNLHTLKGSARMAGAMALGQHMHEMETRIENIAHAGLPSSLMLDDLLARYDYALYMFEQLQDPNHALQAAPYVEQASGGEAGDEKSSSQSPTVPAASSTANSAALTGMPALPLRANETGKANLPVTDVVAQTAATPLVRVRADILDRLVNQAGEVSISRSKLENEVGSLRTSLGELSENVVRLRDQLREIEMQAESQITSHMASSADREFDPLEFDRFTRLQELTRMMAESVNDVGSVQQNLNKSILNATNDLRAQSGLTRDLQQELMRVRMVQFASISERLYRVTRQTAKETDKRVNLDIRGSAVEIDRSVLEKMTGPFEHLLRNAIVHGIESRERRRAAGKDETGELRIEIRQEGNEVVIHFSDDGQGLNLESIRNKALTNGLLQKDEQVSDAEITDLIFNPGFSTAEVVTELAGRGVGMDVVRSEAASLGGRVSITSKQGEGAHFTIHLPLTLAVTQVVLLSTGGTIYAVPSVLVEQVQQLKTGSLSAAYNEGAVIWQSQRVPMYYLSSLLGDADAVPVTQQYSPLLILKSGADRVALHVDEIIGNREVVIKNIGPQLSRMIGIAGATVLGSGDIVLILNPLPLAQKVVHDNIRAPRRSTSADMPDGMGAVAEMATFEPVTARQVTPVQGLRTQHIVMVVDDSLTVRRVTQRLLVREGYQVVLAKDGVDALQHLQSVTPDVMLVDIEMPRMDGFDLTRNLRDDERTQHIPIIMITSRTASKHRNYAMELGVNEYLGKPYPEDRLLELIAGFIAKETPVN